MKKNETGQSHRKHFLSPIGVLCMEDDGDGLTALYFDDEGLTEDYSSELLDRAEKEIYEYLAGERREFDLPLHPVGTEFQHKVWNALREIPYGETRSYSEIAAAVGSPKACRAVGGANHKNPLMLLIPCHRVIGKNGTLTGFGGGLDVKQYLLELESSEIN